MAVTGLAAMLWRAEPVSRELLLGLILASLFCSLGSICFLLAVKHTSAANVSQYHYTQLPTGALVTYLLWRELPTAHMVLGGALIVAAGLYIAVGAYRAAPLERVGV